MFMNDISRSKLVRYFCGTSDTNDTSKTANSSDASKTSASVTQLSSYLVNLKTTLFGSPYQSIFFSTKAPKSSKRKVKLSTDIVNN